MTQLLTLPGSYVRTISVEPEFDASEATDQLFMAGIFEKGPVGPVRVLTEAKLETLYGKRVVNSTCYDSARTFLQRGRALVLSRVTGPAPVLATLTLSNSVPAAVLRVDALSYGAWGNDLRVTVTAGTAPSTVVITISDSTGALEVSPDLATQAEIKAWGDGSDYVRITVLGGSGLPAPLTQTHLAGGTDDAASAADAQYQAGLDQFNDPRLGPGQVCIPGRTTAATHAMLRAHADPVDGYDRHALLDLPDTGSKATLVGAVQSQHLALAAGNCSAYTPWVKTTDGWTIPPSAVVGAAIAASDLKSITPDLISGNQNLPVAGDNGNLDWIGALTQSFTDIDRQTLNDNGVNVIYDVTGQGKYQIYGNRTLVDEDLDPLNLQTSNVRLDMAIRWKARKIGKRYVFRQIDGQKHLATAYGADLQSMLRDYYQADALFGATEDEAFLVDTLSVNTPTTAAARKLLGTVKLRRSPGSERVELTIYNYAVTEAL